MKMQAMIEVTCGSGDCVGGACHSECDARGLRGERVATLTSCALLKPINAHLSRQQNDEINENFAEHLALIIYIMRK